MSTTLDDAAMKRIKEALVARAKQRLAVTEQAADLDDAAAQVVEDSSVSEDDVWQAEVAGDMSELLDAAADHRSAALKAIEDLDMSPTDVIRPGAIVEVGGYRYVAGIVVDGVEVDGVAYDGLSLESPLYQAIEGKHVGDEVVVNGKKQKITLIA